MAWSLPKEHSVYCRQSGSPSSLSERTKESRVEVTLDSPALADRQAEPTRPNRISGVWGDNMLPSPAAWA